MLSTAAPDRGALFVLSGPSGVGKSTLIRHVMDTVPDVGFSVSATTRGPRAGEEDGVHYHFLTKEDFLQRVGEDAFLEHAEVYGRHYGTLVEPVERALAAGRSILLDIDVQGAEQVKRRMPEAVSVFLLPPSREALEKRLRGRGTDAEEVIARRMAEADEQLAAMASYDFLVVNDHLESAKQVLAGVLLATLSRTALHDGLVKRWTR